MNFIDFFPNNPNQDSADFYQKLYQQKEFYDLSISGKNGMFYHHQLIPQRFLSPWTFYQSLFLIHETGTGKSGCVASVIDVLKTFDETIPVLYVTSNDTLIKNFKNELVKLCPWLQSKMKTWRSDKYNSLFRRYRFYFTTFGSFEKEIQKIPMTYLDKVLVVLDEAHHLVTKHMKNYQKVQEFLNRLTNRKLMVSTATPMRDNAIELIYLLNLVLPTPLPIGQDFIDEYLLVDKKKDGDLYRWKQGKDIQFRQNIRGYVSVFRQKIENISVKYRGAQISDEFMTKVYLNKMTSYQESVYMNTWNKDKAETIMSIPEKEDDEDANVYDTLYNNSVQSSLMVFPDNLYGSLGVAKYCVNDQQFSVSFFKETNLKRNPQSEKEIENNLNIIKQYSIVYHDIIRSILKAKQTKKLLYVYSEKINNSGILRCIYLLQQCFNFHRVTSNMTNVSVLSTLKDRFIFLHDDDTLRLLQIFNDSKNKNGDYVRVIFGTDKTTEGITLKNVQQIHIVTPGWNFGKKNQAEGRGYRLGSHADFGNKSVTLEIFLHCVVPRNLQDSVNVLQYIRSEIKERNIYLFSYALLISAIDCQMNYYQNCQKDADDYSTTCYLEKCEYKCDGITKVKVPSNELYQGNYNSYFVETNYKVIEEIISLFQINPLAKTFTEIETNLSHFHFSKFQIFYGILKIISTPVPIPLMNGISVFLQVHGNYIYLTSDRHTKIWGIIGPDFCTKHLLPCFRVKTNCTTVKQRVFRNYQTLSQRIFIWENFLRKDDQYNITKYFRCFPDFFQSILIKKHPCLRQLQTIKINEKDRSIEIRGHIPIHVPNVDTDLESNPFGFYAIRDRDTFKIKDIIPEHSRLDKRKVPKGQVVKTIEIQKLIRYISLLKTKIDDHLESFVSSERDSILESYKRENPVTIDSQFEQNILSKYKLFESPKNYTSDEKRLILFLFSAFGSRKQPLIAILEFEILRNNLMI